MFCRSLFVHLSFFPLTIVLSVLLRYTDSDYPFGIFKLFLQDLPIWETSRMTYKKQEVLTLQEHLDTLVGSVLLILSVFWALFFYLFAFVLCLVYNVVCVFGLPIRFSLTFICVSWHFTNMWKLRRCILTPKLLTEVYLAIYERGYMKVGGHIHCIRVIELIFRLFLHFSNPIIDLF